MKAQVYLTTKMVLLTMIVLCLTTVSYGVENQIISVEPDSAFQGETGLTITFTLDTDVPPAPPAEVLPQSVTIGDIAGTSIAHPGQYTVTAVFDITSIAGVNDVEITFETPQGTLVFSMAEGFTITEATDIPSGITIQPQSQTIASGNPVTFTVGAWGTQPLSYQWFKDDISISGANDSSFMIESVKQSDQGNYCCLVMNDYGYAISKDATLTVSTESPFEGYNLFSPMMSTETYLMDNDGNFIHSWSSNYGVGLSVYFLEDGTLLRTANTGGTSFDVGGAGGRVEQYNWDNDLLWSFDYSNSEHRLHHDIEMLPNENILMIAWELKTESEAIAAGRDPSLLAEGQLWLDYIIEVEPTGSSGGNIVWQWHTWDHLIQDYDSTKPNYGTVADHPEKINLNFVLNNNADWNHFNSIDYNAELDQILLSVHNFSEIWIIDHNTTTADAAGNAGDLLYRWGNPQTYDSGGPDDQQLFAQHDAEWIESGLPGEGDILIFNNGLGRPDGNYSSVVQITPPLNPDGGYTLETGYAYGPDTPTWTYTSTPVTDFFAERISGAQRLADGHTLICEGTKGRLFEVTSDGTIVWEYNYGGEIFRAERFGPDYPGFKGTELEPEPLPIMQYAIVDTGQIECYNNSMAITPPALGETFYGQDAQYNGNQPDYTLSGDGLTVTDNVTGLTWTQSPDWNGDGTINSDDKFTFDETQAYPEILNAAQFGGYSDWRVPTIKELYSLMNFRGTDPMVMGDDTSGLIPYVDTDYFAFGYGDTSAGERIIDAQWASSTLYVSTTMGGNETMFGLNLADGRIKGYPTNKLFYVYFVRGNLDYGLNNLVDNGDGTISDEATGLMWSQDDSDAGMNWEDALAWVQTKNAENYLGYNDWRLPNAKEIQSIVDYTRSPDTTGSAAIDPLFNTTQITNEAGQADYPFFWSSTTHVRFDGNGSSGVYICFGRGMGTMDGINAIDVHGAGCQRSDPKDGNPDDYPSMGNGPQGDVQRVFNYVRLVRDIN